MIIGEDDNDDNDDNKDNNDSNDNEDNDIMMNTSMEDRVKRNRYKQ